MLMGISGDLRARQKERVTASDLTGCNLSMYMYRFEFDINICRRAFDHYDTVAQSSFCFMSSFFL